MVRRRFGGEQYVPVAPLRPHHPEDDLVDGSLAHQLYWGYDRSALRATLDALRASSSVPQDLVDEVAEAVRAAEAPPRRATPEPSLRNVMARPAQVRFFLDEDCTREIAAERREDGTYELALDAGEVFYVKFDIFETGQGR